MIIVVSQSSSSSLLFRAKKRFHFSEQVHVFQINGKEKKIDIVQYNKKKRYEGKEKINCFSV